MKRRLPKLIAIFVTVLGCLVCTFTPAKALSGSEFQASRITDDSIFFNSGSMNSGDIQNFLNAKVPNCDTNGTQNSSHWNGSRYYTRAEWGTQNGYAPPYTCLKDYSESIPNKSADSYCDGNITTATRSGAQIIYDVARACGVNPQALLVTLQKEQSLVTDDWPWSIQYRSAMGYGCPDTAACDSAYYGFFNQVYNAARQFKRYARQPNTFNYRSGATAYVQYNPNSGCGGSNVSIQSAATAGLYNYTPYQPNQAALNNLYGTGDSCSAYGNRNYWRMFNDWFGATNSGETYYIRHIKKVRFNDTEQLFTSTDTQLFLNAWWSGSNGIQRTAIATSPGGERILDFDVHNDGSGSLAVYIATESGIYKSVSNDGRSFSKDIPRVITLANTKGVVADQKDEGGQTTFRLYVLANDGPYEYWWRNNTVISSGYRLWNINNALKIYKSVAFDGRDEVYVAAPYNVYRMKWPINSEIERIAVTSLRDTVDLQKHTKSDGTELLYTVTKTGVHETWWRPGSGFSNPAKIITLQPGEEVKEAKKTMTGGYEQLYLASKSYVREYWWGPGSVGVRSSDALIHISQNNISGIDKTSSGNIQNLYTAYQSFVFETWWGNGRLNNGPAIVNLNR